MTQTAEPTHRTRPRATGSLRADVRGAMTLAGLLVDGRLSTTRRASKQARDRRYIQFWVDAARALDLSTRRVGEGLEIALDGGTIEVHRSANTLDPQQVLDRAGDKALVHRLLAENGVPVTEHRSFTLATLSDAAEFLAAAPGPCVVKPARDTSAGHGVTTNVVGPRSLRAAAARRGPGCRPSSPSCAPCRC